MSALKTAIQGMLPPLMAIAEEGGGMQEARRTRKQDWPQKAEGCVRGMNAVSPEA